ncbi:hypothetical protein OJ570_000262 [Escherichia coli]|nr:hypothetical protein [Escherichia coli]
MNWFNHGKVDIIVIDRFYRREEVDKLPEHIKNNLRPVVDGLTVEHHRWPNRKEMLFVIQDGEQQRLARWYPLGMQDEVFRQYIYRHGFPDSWGTMAHIRPGMSPDYPITSLQRFLPLNTFAEGVAVTVDHLTYPNRLEDGGYNTETEQGCMYVHDNIAIQIDHLLKRGIKPVYMTTWRDERAARAVYDKLQSVRPVRYDNPSSIDTLRVLRDFSDDLSFIHPLGFVKPAGVRWNDDLQRVEVNIGIRSQQLNWVPVVGVENQTEQLVEDIEHTGYVRWDISDLKP